jgi:hypothetical protein
MPFGVGGFSRSKGSPFSGKLDKKFSSLTKFNGTDKRAEIKNPFDPSLSPEIESEVRFYNHDSLWARWRRGYELYSITQSALGSSDIERPVRGDYRLYFSFQQYPGVFVPARLFTYPSTNQDIGEQLVGMRDTNSFTFYDYGLPILGVRYVGASVEAVYTQSGTVITVTKADHGLFPGDSVYLAFSSGTAVNNTLTITEKTQNTFTVTAGTPLTTSGNVAYAISTAFTDSRWRFIRVALRFLPTETALLPGERMTDRVIERDPGITATYSRTGSTVTVTCTLDHGLSTGNTIYLDIGTGLVSSGRYEVTVTSATVFEITTITSGSTLGNATVNRLLRGFNYLDYVGYTVTGSDATTNELIFQRDDSYAAKTTNGITATVVPAHRGFQVGRYLTTELRWQCSCEDFSKRDNYNLYSQLRQRRFPQTQLANLKPGLILNPDGTFTETRDSPGVFQDIGYTTINNFYELPEYEDIERFSFQNLLYYQMRWCKHIYASMWALIHDEGGGTISINARYEQSGPNITVTAPNHGLLANRRIQLDFTSGNAIEGEYTITSVPTKDTFTIVYPFADTTSGYCTVSNLKPHEYVNTWLLEPSDQPVGTGLETFYKNFDRESQRLKEVTERYVFDSQNLGWAGSQVVTGAGNNPEQAANFGPALTTMVLTDNIRRNEEGKLSRIGIVANSTNRFTGLVNKLFNLDPKIIQEAKFGFLDKPLSEYTSEFEFGFVDGGEYRNGVPLENVDTLVQIEAETYSPVTALDTIVDASLYINS